jgi:hypothetical protein
MARNPNIQQTGHLQRASRTVLGVETFVPIRVALMQKEDANFWHGRVQPFVRASAEIRADKKWDWRIFRRVLPLSQWIQRRRCLALTTFAENANGDAVPIAMHLLIERYAHLPDHTQSATFVWFLCVMPKEAYSEFSIGGTPSMGRICVDIALTASNYLGNFGRIGLHAAPAGGDRLKGFYKNHCKLLNLDGSSPLPALHANDGGFFYTERELADRLLKDLDHLR